jgi:hypothetical protein
VRYPFLVAATFGLDAALSIKLPDGYRVAYQPPGAQIQQGPFAYRISSAHPAGELLLDFTSVWKGAVVQPGAYPDLWRAHAQASEPGNALVLLERK